MAELEPENTANPPLIEFPCDFPIKVMGEMQDVFSATVIGLIQTILPEFNAGNIEMRASSGGKYISLTCTVHVTSQVQLDDIYRLLTAHPLVKYTL
jgi:putative lipoic acid-binding regulatory protein